MRSPAIRIHEDEIIVDSFAGGGGASLGIEMALGRSPDIAINHDAEAIATVPACKRCRGSLGLSDGPLCVWCQWKAYKAWQASKARRGK